MNFLIIFFMCFFFAMSFFEFKKAYGLRGFNSLIKGKITGVTPSENGLFFEITYQDNSENRTYQHCFTKQNLSVDKIQFLAEHYLESPFYLFAKKEENKIIEVKSYSNSKVMSWLYLIGGLATSSWFLF